MNDPKFPKPGTKKKTAKIKNKSTRLHDIDKPKTLECKQCGIETGTECMRHSEATEIKFLSGGGIMGGKINDNLTGWLCQKCDLELSTKPDKNAHQSEHDRHALKWYRVIIKTHNI